MSSIVRMRPFSPVEGNTAKVARVYRSWGFWVDPGDPIIEVALGANTLTVRGGWYDGGVMEQHVRVGSEVKAGDPIVTLTSGGAAFANAVFIAYRRADSSGYTGRIYDGVARDLGRQQVFRDIGSLKPGRDIRDQVASVLRYIYVMVVVIAPGWLTATDHLGQPRLADPNDLHRMEIRTAIERGRPIVPILVGGAAMPREDQLPEDIRALTRPLAITISDDRWDAGA